MNSAATIERLIGAKFSQKIDCLIMSKLSIPLM